MNIFFSRTSLPTFVGVTLFFISTVILSFGLFASVASAAALSLTVTSPNNGTEQWNGAKDITWTVNSGTGNIDVNYVTVNTDGSDNTVIPIATVDSALGTYLWDTTSTGSDGTNYKIRVYSTDGSVSYDTSDNAFTVDNTTPTFSVGDGTDLSPVQTDTINVTVADATSGVNSSTLYYGFSSSANSCSSAAYVSTDTFASGTNFTISGNHTDYLCVKATDNAGNIGYQQVGKLNTDNTQPQLTSTTPYTLNGLEADAYFNPTFGPLPIVMNANEPVTWTTVRIKDMATGLVYKDKHPTGISALLNTTWDGSISAGPLTDGAYQIFYTITDIAGNITGPLVGPLAPYKIHVDTVAPTMTSVVGTTIQGAGDTIVVTFGENVVPTDSDWTNGGELTFESPIGTTVDLTGASYAFNAGTNVLTVTLGNSNTANDHLKNTNSARAIPVTGAIKDLAGNALTTSADSSSTISGDTSTPTVGLTYDIDRQVKDADTIKITTTFNEAMESTPTIAIATLGTGSLTAIAMVPTTGDQKVWTYDWNVPTGSTEDGTATITITGEDLAGNTINNSSNTRTIDNTPPTVDTFTSPVADTVYRTNTILSFTASDTGTGSGPVCSYTLNTDSPVTTSCSGSSVPVTGLAEGRNDIVVTVTDEAGNTVTSSPVVSFVYDADGILTVGATGADFPTIQGAITAAVVPGITTIRVADGTYNQSINVNKSLIVESVTGAANTIIVGQTPMSSVGNAITIGADNVTINGFTIENPTGTVGVAINGNNGTAIRNNTITNIDGDAVGSGNQGITVTSSGATDITGVTIENNQINAIRHTAVGRSASGITVGFSSGTFNIGGLVINNNIISDITANTTAWPAGHGAYGILINHKTTGAHVTNNTVTNLDGLWAHGIGLEGDTPSAVVTGNTISNLTDYKSPSDAIAIWAEDNPSVGTVAVHNNKFSGVNVGVALKPTTVTGVLDATNNWWGVASGPFNATTNPNGTGAEVLPSINDGYTNYVRFNPFYNSDAMATSNLVSSAPIASFDLAFAPASLVVNTPSTLTVTAKDANSYTVVNDSTTQLTLIGDNGSSFGANLLTMGVLGTTGTTVTNSAVGNVNVTANETFGPATGTGVVTFVAGIDTTAPIISNIRAEYITTTGAIIRWTTNEMATDGVDYGTTSSYGSSTTLDTSADNTDHGSTLSGLSAGTLYHYRITTKDATGNTTTSSDNTFTTATADITPPVITLLGQNPMTLTVGDTFTDPGATANDNVDGNITSNIVKTGAVITAAAGTYTVTYNVSDAAGIAAVQATRTVIVVDPVVASVTPVVTLNGTAIASTYSASNAATRFGSGLQFDITNATSMTVNGTSVSGVTSSATPATVLAVSGTDATSLGLHVYNVVVTSTTGDTANIVVAYQVTTDPTVDTTPPVITLLGQNPVTIAKGATYADAGATANDNVDGDITTNIATDTSAVDTATAGTYTVTYNVSDTAGIAAVQATRTVIVVDPAVVPLVPVITLSGTTISSTYSASNAATRFGSGLQFDITNATSMTVNGTSVSGVTSSATPATVLAVSGTDATSLGLHVYNVVVTSTTGDTANVTVSYTVTADFNDTAVLAVTGIDAIKTYATADDTYTNGWSWTYHITVPTSETNFQMKFSDFVSGSNVIPAGSNIRFYTVQASAHADATNAIDITAANTYEPAITLTGDLSPTTPGRQIDVTVEMKVPTSTPGGSYSADYGVNSTI